MSQRVISRIIAGLGANGYGQIVTIVIQLVGVPILLNYWGVRLYGEWLILFAIPSYLTLGDIGLSQSVSTDMAARIARGDNEGAIKEFQSFSMLICLIVMMGLLVITLIAVFLPSGDWFNFSELTTIEIHWLIWLLSAEVLLTLLEGIWHAVMYSNGEYPLSSFIYSTTVFIQYGSVWLCAMAGYDPVVAATAFLLVRLIFVLFVSLLSVKRHPLFWPSFRHIHWNYIQPLLRPSFGNIAIPTAETISLQGMVLVIGSIIGPIGVVVFSALRTLTRFILSLVRAVNNAIRPELSRALGSGNQNLLQTIYLRGIQGSFWISICALIGLASVGTPLLRIWTNGKVTMDLNLFYFLLISVVAASVWSVSMTLLQAGNLHFKSALWFVVISAISVVLAILLLISTHSLAYAGFSLLLMNILMILVVVKTANAHAKVSLKRIFIEVFNIRPVINFFYKRYIGN